MTMSFKKLGPKILVIVAWSSSLGLVCASARHPQQPAFVFVAPTSVKDRSRTSTSVVATTTHARVAPPSILFSSVTAAGSSGSESARPRRRRRPSSASSPSSSSSSSSAPLTGTPSSPSASLAGEDSSAGKETALHPLKNQLLHLLSQVPPNRPTPASQTKDILSLIRQLEQSCPTSDHDIVAKLGGTWDLLWTTQDTAFPESKLGAWINPLENQAYSNNPTGRANPILPRTLQDQLERAGFLATDDDTEVNRQSEGTSAASTPPVTIKSTQSIDIQQGKVRNVVSFGLVTRPPSSLRSSDTTNPFRRRRQRLEWWIGTNPEEERRQRLLRNQSPRVLRASMTVLIDFTQDAWDPRRINVKFESSRLSIPSLKLDWYFPLGIFGPTGWLRTVYLDDTLRITRGHKGSVFVLQRPGSRTVTTPSSSPARNG